METERHKTILVKQYPSHRQLLKHIEKLGRPIIPELSTVMGVSIETIRFMLNGRYRGNNESSQMVLLGLTGIDNPLVRFVGKRMSERRGPKADEYELTEFGRDVASLLA